jgi:hypothetical protein
MGRSKPSAPKRRRCVLEDNIHDNHNDQAQQDQSAAIALLRQTPQEAVELAAAEAFRMNLVYWPKLLTAPTPVAVNDTTASSITSSTTTTMTTVPSWANGLGRSRPLEPSVLEALQRLHLTIQRQTKYWTSWSGNKQDPRKRAFGFLPGTLGYSHYNDLDISMPWRRDWDDDHHGNGGGDDQDDENKERQRNRQAMVVLKEVPEGVIDAIQQLCLVFRKDLLEQVATDHDDDDADNDVAYHAKLANFLDYSNLIAAQPNLHSGRSLLPVHLDHPQKDGFGVVIVTIAMRGHGQILLQSSSASSSSSEGDSDGKRLVMSLAEGEAYMLAGRSRDACAHGVLTEESNCHRESLNLRFGLHGMPPVAAAVAPLPAAATVTAGVDAALTPAVLNASSVDSSRDSSSNNHNINKTQSSPPIIIPASQVLQYWE